ncbi:MAG: purine-nucleoside phosphorylase [Saprospiraceae bacterium]
MVLYDKIQEAKDYLADKLNFSIDYGIVAGTGLNQLVVDMKNAIEISYADIPHFPTPTVEGHQGKMIVGKLGNKNVLVMRGRFHYYEGYSLEEVTFYVRVLNALGIKNLIITNATGALNPDIPAGGIVFVNDHINLQPENPLRGLNDSRLGNRFPAMGEVYDKNWLAEAKIKSKELNIPFHEGVYLGIQGPSLETMAEYKYFHKMGGDVVGMSTVPEVIVAAQCEMKVLCISIATNNPFSDGIKTTLEEVIQVANKGAKKVRRIILELMK